MVRSHFNESDKRRYTSYDMVYLFVFMTMCIRKHEFEDSLTWIINIRGVIEKRFYAKP